MCYFAKTLRRDGYPPIQRLLITNVKLVRYSCGTTLPSAMSKEVFLTLKAEFL